MAATYTTVSVLPDCDFCTTQPARYDGITKLGAWANMCPEHFKQYGLGLGTGRGQELRLPSGHDDRKRNKRSTS